MLCQSTCGFTSHGGIIHYVEWHVYDINVLYVPATGNSHSVDHVMQL